MLRRFLDSLRIGADIFYSSPGARVAHKSSRRFVDQLAKSLQANSELLQFKINLDFTSGGLGDFLVELVLARALQEVDSRITVPRRIFGEPYRFENLRESGFSPEERKKEFEALLRLNPTGVNFSDFESDVKVKSLIDIVQEFGWQDSKRVHKGAGNIRLINYLASMFGLNPTTIFTWSPVGQYVGLHVRGTPPHEGRNPTKNQTECDILDLADKFPNLSVRVFSSPRPPYLELLVKDLAKSGVNVEFQNSTDFCAAIPEILASDFWFQRKGGGAGLPVLYSEMPYLMFSSDFGAKNVYRGGRGRFADWSSADQRVITSYTWAESGRAADKISLT